jgi:hypothetical protein
MKTYDVVLIDSKGNQHKARVSVRFGQYEAVLKAQEIFRTLNSELEFENFDIDKIHLVCDF